MSAPIQRSPLEATITANGDGTYKFCLRNRTGHAEDFRIIGVDPEVTLTLDGNTGYSVNLRPHAQSTIVEVSGGGDILAFRDIEH